jgi:hypothetical protein
LKSALISSAGVPGARRAAFFFATGAIDGAVFAGFFDGSTLSRFGAAALPDFEASTLAGFAASTLAGFAVVAFLIGTGAVCAGAAAGGALRVSAALAAFLATGTVPGAGAATFFVAGACSPGDGLDAFTAAFRFAQNEDAMATEKTAEGIRKFGEDIVKLEKLVQSL